MDGRSMRTSRRYFVTLACLLAASCETIHGISRQLSRSHPLKPEEIREALRQVPYVEMAIQMPPGPNVAFDLRLTVRDASAYVEIGPSSASVSVYWVSHVPSEGELRWAGLVIDHVSDAIAPFL